MSKHRAEILAWVAGLLVFAILLYFWKGFLDLDRCLDWGGAMENGTCVGTSTAIPSFWEAPWGFKLFTLVPPCIVSGLIIATGLWLIETGVTDDA